MTAQIEPKLFFMRPGFAISCIGHVAMLTIALMFAGANPFESAPADALTVEIVPANEIETGPEPEAAPAAAAENTPSLEPATSTQQPQPAPPSPSTPQASSTLDQRTTQQALAPTQALPSFASSMPWFRPLPEPAPPPETHDLNPADVFGMPLAMPDGQLGGGFDAAAVDQADISNDNIAAFHQHLKTCSTLPAGVNKTDKLKVVLRIRLSLDGTLAAPPEPIWVEQQSGRGGALFQNAILALRQCQPYNMLPRDKYDEWKVFDLSFTPQSFGGG